MNSALTEAIKCPNCGGTLSITSNTIVCRCEFCDSQITVNEVKTVYKFNKKEIYELIEHKEYFRAEQKLMSLSNISDDLEISYLLGLCKFYSDNRLEKIIERVIQHHDVNLHEWSLHVRKANDYWSTVLEKDVTNYKERIESVLEAYMCDMGNQIEKSERLIDRFTCDELMDFVHAKDSYGGEYDIFVNLDGKILYNEALVELVERNQIIFKGRYSNEVRNRIIYYEPNKRILMIEHGGRIEEYSYNPPIANERREVILAARGKQINADEESKNRLAEQQKKWAEDKEKEKIHKREQNILDGKSTCCGYPVQAIYHPYILFKRTAFYICKYCGAKLDYELTEKQKQVAKENEILPKDIASYKFDMKNGRYNKPRNI
ncbi:MAG: hypothetical protein MJ124_03505 [Lachnospiraceae bacterium]|nr:hypothetical protein [Lachnospiraceae bacterium]